MSLSLAEKYQLLSKYKTELKLLEFQINRVKLTIHDIEKDIGGSSQLSDTTSTAVDLVSKTETVRPKPISSQKLKLGPGYKLSKWDAFILDCLEESQKVLLQLEIREMVVDELPLSKGMDESQVVGKINRSLQKLVNKRGIILKIPYIGKGYFYGLKEWLDEEGNMPKSKLREEF